MLASLIALPGLRMEEDFQACLGCSKVSRYLLAWLGNTVVARKLREQCTTQWYVPFEGPLDQKAELRLDSRTLWSA
jgi:hypothetical protein